ncbi:hypothetical protein L208DRAFT_1014419, partial [Tricholoma matsutake]
HSDVESHSHPAVVASLVHHCQWREAPGICAQTDLEVWDLPDEDIIITASRAVWRSEVYDHYDVSLIC